MKKHLEISSVYTSVPKIIIICYTVPEIWCMTDVTVIFQIKILKNKKKTPGNIILHMCTKNYEQTVPEMWCATDGWTDGQTEKVTYRGGCHT